MRIGRVISSEVGKNRDGDGDVLLLTVEISEPGDEQTVEYMQAAGEDFNPPEDTTVIVADLGEAWKIALGADDGITPESLPGEKEIYALLAGVKKGRLKCNLDGTVQAGVTGLGFVAMATKVLSELNAIRTAFDAHIHTHPMGPTGVPVTPMGPASPVLSTNFLAEE